jgi:cation diffusion facilitator CzcD-associated flavoprotein CzcO
MSSVQKFLVIGAGPVGLGVARALKSHSISYDQVDSSDAIGGNWYHGVYETVHIVSSRRTTEFPEFPMPANYPEFPSRQQILDYLTAYSRQFRLLENIAFRKTVTKVTPSVDSTWQATFDNEESRIYRGIIVCHGHHWDRRWPNYPGDLAAQYIHSKDYKTPDQLRGKRVLVIGGGSSACDIVSEAARVGASAHLSLRRGYWFLPKALFGRPIVDLARHYWPVWTQRAILRLALKVAVGDYRKYGLPTPDHRLFERHPSISNELFYYLKHGKIIVRPDIRKFDERFVEFTDGTREAFDLVVAATGFHLSFPFLASDLINVKGQTVEVYGHMIAAGHRHLYLVGWNQPRYGFGPLVAPAADLLAEIIKLQEGMRSPIGSVLKRLGQKPPRTHIFDPFRLKLEIELTRQMLPFIRILDHWVKFSIP